METHTKNDSEANEKTDSEDDIPLKNISSKNKDVVGKRKGGFNAVRKRWR